jgi:hypothetical protein
MLFLIFFLLISFLGLSQSKAIQYVPVATLEDLSSTLIVQYVGSTRLIIKDEHEKILYRMNELGAVLKYPNISIIWSLTDISVVTSTAYYNDELSH